MTKDEVLTVSANREFKASAFTAYFSVPENAAALYRALEQEEGIIKPEDIMYTTLEGVLFMARKNDLAFTVKEKVLVIGEHQSTLNWNMPLRSAIYYGRTMERLIPPRDIYKTRQIMIPTPEFYCFYNGTRKQPAEQILRLSDAYLESTENPMLELTVKMININLSAGHPLLEKCHAMYEYASFIQKIREYMEQELGRSQAIEEAMNDCLENGIMVDFIHEHGSEVINMLFTEFNMEDALEVRGEECYDEGKIAGRTEGRTEGKTELGIHLIRRNTNRGMTAADIADLLDLDTNYVLRIAELCGKYSDEEIAGLTLAEQEKKS